MQSARQNLRRFLISITTIAFCILFVVVPQVGFGLAQDKTQSARFISDHVIFNHITGTTVFTGRVKMTQGTTQLKGDKVTVYRLPTGVIHKVIALGKLAHYQTLPDNQKKILDAYAQRIEYYPLTGIAILIGQGKIVQGLNSFRGPYIVYNMVKQVITSAPTKTNTQSVIVIPPQDPSDANDTSTGPTKLSKVNG